MSALIQTALYFVLLLSTVPSFAQNTILIVGDSLSAGYGMDLNESWVALLNQQLMEKKYRYKVINASISGDTTQNGLIRLPQALKTYQPSITVIALGGNDGLRAIPIATIKNNLKQMIVLCQAAKSRVLLVGLRLPPNLGPQYTQAFEQIFPDLAKLHHTALVPLLLAQVDENPEMMFPNDVHPNSKAQKQLLKNVWVVLEKML